MKMKKV